MTIEIGTDIGNKSNFHTFRITRIGFKHEKSQQYNITPLVLKKHPKGVSSVIN